MINFFQNISTKNKNPTNYVSDVLFGTSLVEGGLKLLHFFLEEKRNYVQKYYQI